MKSRSIGFHYALGKGTANLHVYARTCELACITLEVTADGALNMGYVLC